MVRSFGELSRFAIRATDGPIGTVRDLYFDDSTWRIRYCVVDTGGWFANRLVLVGPRALSIVDLSRRELWVRLSKADIMRSRTTESDKPVSRQRRGRFRVSRASDEAQDPHLRSCRAVLRHRLQAIDGQIGRVGDFLIDEKGWVIRNLVVDTRTWNAPGGLQVLVEPQSVAGISWPRSSVSVDLTRAVLLTAPTYQPTPVTTTLPPVQG